MLICPLCSDRILDARAGVERNVRVVDATRPPMETGTTIVLFVRATNCIRNDQRVVLQVWPTADGRLKRDHQEGNPTGDLQVATNRVRANSLRHGRVASVLAVVPRCRRAAQRAWPRVGPHDNLTLGPALRSRTVRSGCAVI